LSGIVSALFGSASGKMTKRRKNPVHASGKPFRYKLERDKDGNLTGQRVPKEVLTSKRARKEFTRTVNYLERVEAMRPYFRDVFTPDAGFDLRDIDKWTPAKKRKITRYFRIMAPRLTGGEKVVKRYRRQDHLDEAIRSSLQEEMLPGQTAAVFSVDPGQNLKITFNRAHKAKVTRGGILEDEIRFDKNAFLKDWKKEVNKALEQTDAKLFKIITGANRSERTFTRMSLIEEIAILIEQYSLEELDPKSFDDKWFGEWLNGIVGYKGVTMRKLIKTSKDHKVAALERRRQHNKDRAKRRRKYASKNL